MKIQQLLERRFTYEVGDRVKTPFGDGVIVKDLGATEHDHYFGVVFDERVRKANNLPARPIRMGSFEMSGIVQKGSSLDM